MARVHISLSDEDRARFQEQAAREGLSLSAWLCADAKRRALENDANSQAPPWAPSPGKRLRTSEEVREFFRKIHEKHGPNPEPEPDWVETKKLILESMDRRLPEP